MLSIGLDVHQRTTALCQMDAGGRVVKERVIRGGFDAVAAHLRTVGEPFRVCFEASCGYGTLYDMLTPIAADVQVAHPTELKLIFRSKHKNDRNDARKLAKLLHMDAIPRVHVPSIDVRAWRGFIEHRRRLVDRRGRCKCMLRALFRGLGIRTPSGQKLWSETGLRWLESQELPTTLDRLRRASLLSELRLLGGEIRAAERELDAIGRKDWRVTLLRTIPGVGPRTAEAVAAYIDDPSRFTSIKSIGRYFGVVPCQDASAGRNRLGHITRQGPATVRKMITQAAWQAVRRSQRIKAWYERVKGGQKQRTGVALIAVGYKLLRIMLSMLRSGECWRDEMADAPDAVVAVPAAASAECTEAMKPGRRGRGNRSAVRASGKKTRKKTAPDRE